MIFIFWQSSIHDFTGLVGTKIMTCFQSASEHYTGIVEVIGLNPVLAWIFLRPYLHYCLSGNHYGKDDFHTHPLYLCCYFETSLMQIDVVFWRLRLKKKLTANTLWTTWFASLKSRRRTFVKLCVIWNPTASALILINEWEETDTTNVNWIMLLKKDTNASWRRNKIIFIMQLRWVIFCVMNTVSVKQLRSRLHLFFILFKTTHQFLINFFRFAISFKMRDKLKDTSMAQLAKLIS